MAFLVFQLIAPLASWGGTAVGEYRPTHEYPGESALIGLLGAALGVRREDEASHAALRRGYGFAVGVLSSGKLIRDYHTAQVPGQAALKKRPHASRRDELALPKEQLNTVLSTRDYRQDAAALVAVQPFDEAPHPLDVLAEALRKPRFVLYLGRKACPPAAPLNPQVLATDTACAAFYAYRELLNAAREKHRDRKGRLPLEDVGEPSRIIWGEGVNAGQEPDLTVLRKDRLIRRNGWQFGDRYENVKLLEKGE